MNYRLPVSSYLVRTSTAAPRRSVTLRTTLAAIWRNHPLIIWRTAMALLVWTALNISVTYLLHQPLLPGQVAAAGNVITPAPTPLANVTEVKLASATINTKVTTLGTNDATGQMLPPIAMAAPGTFRNNYDWGQCTWYVAGRRRVPSNWGNADNWYYAARRAGWNTGTIPAVGSIATTSAGVFGHVALVERISADYSQVYVSEMNYVGVGIRSYRWVPTSSFRYIY